MPRLALKPDSSFFRKIAMGAVGTRAVCEDLARQGHALIELERGSLDTKLWKDVKRKRVRIPDLVCQRAVSGWRAVRRLSRSYRCPTAPPMRCVLGTSAWSTLTGSPSGLRRCCEQDWSSGRLGPESSYWHERNWVKWERPPHQLLRVHHVPVQSRSRKWRPRA